MFIEKNSPVCDKFDLFTQCLFLVKMYAIYLCRNVRRDWNILLTFYIGHLIHLGLLSREAAFKNSCGSISRGWSPGATAKGLDFVFKYIS